MKKILIILYILVPIYLYSQEIVFQQEQYPFPVTFHGVEPHLGFMGADAYYHHDFGDLDNDGDYDLIIGASMGKEYFYENIGNNSIADFQLITTQIVVPTSNTVHQAPHFCDIDADGDLDLFVANFFGPIAFFENIGTPDSAEFILADSTFADIDISEEPVMAFTDIDNDNDYDLFIGAGWATQDGRIYYYLNEGTPDSADMVYVTDFFESIDVGHDASPEFVDIDEDDDYDLFVGCEDGTIWFYENIGTPDSCDFEYVTDNYFDIYTGEVSVPRFCDIDNDGDYDLFVANESAGNTQGFEGDIAFYENTGDEYNAEFTFVTGNYLFMDMSMTSSPAIVDIDDDGLLELLIGIMHGDVVLFENNGSQNDPSFYFADSIFSNLDLTYQPVMSFGDLDADGDYDVAVQRTFFNDSSIQIWTNIGDPEHPVFGDWSIVYSNYDNDHGGISLCDIDGDEDLDLFFGDGQNHLYYWENTGDIYDPRFESVSSNYLNLPPGFYDLYPCFSDIDHDGDNDLIMGHSAGTLYHNYIILWLNIGTIYEADFVIEDTLFTFEPSTINTVRPYLADIDADGDDDMFVGEGGGAMLFFRNMEFNSVNRKQKTDNRSFTLFPNYPNPFNALTTIPFTLDQTLPVKIVVYNQLGQNVVTLFDGMLDSGIHQVNWDADGVSSGVYLIRLDTQAGYNESRKVMLVK